MPKTTVPLLNPAPPWMPARSDYEILWHGCTLFDKDSMETNGIDLTNCAVDTDFGQGFYTTTLERQAQFWARKRFVDWLTKNPGGSGNQPVVLRFRVRRYSVLPRNSALDDGLDKLLSLQFVRGEYDNESYWSFVQHCRQGSRAAPRDHRRPPTGWYELVVGPVASSWEQRTMAAGSDQWSFHGNAVGLLNALIERGKGKGSDQRGDPDFYQWAVITRQ